MRASARMPAANKMVFFIVLLDKFKQKYNNLKDNSICESGTELKKSKPKYFKTWICP